MTAAATTSVEETAPKMQKMQIIVMIKKRELIRHELGLHPSLSRYRLVVVFLSSFYHRVFISLSFPCRFVNLVRAPREKKYYDGDIYLGLTPRLRIFLGGGILEVLPFRF